MRLHDYRFKIDVKLVWIFLRIQSFHLILEESIGLVIVWERDERWRSVTASCRISDSRWIASAAGTETPIVWILAGAGEHFPRSGKAIKCHAIFFNIFRVVHGNRPVITKTRVMSVIQLTFKVFQWRCTNRQRSEEYMEMLVRSLLGGHPSPYEPLTIPQYDS